MKTITLPTGLARQLFAPYVTHLVDTHPGFTRTLSRVRVGLRILESLERTAPATGALTWELDTADWKAVCGAIEDEQHPVGTPQLHLLDEAGKPSQPVPPRAYLPCADAILGASEAPKDEPAPQAATE